MQFTDFSDDFQFFGETFPVEFIALSRVHELRRHTNSFTMHRFDSIFSLPLKINM